MKVQGGQTEIPMMVPSINFLMCVPIRNFDYGTVPRHSLYCIGQYITKIFDHGSKLMNSCEKYVFFKIDP